MVAWWGDMTTPAWTPELIARVTDQMDEEMDATTTEQLSAARDRLVLGHPCRQDARDRPYDMTAPPHLRADTKTGLRR